MVGAGPTACVLCRRPLPWGHRGGDGGKVTAASRSGSGHWVALARALEPCRHSPSLFPGPLAHPLAQGWGSWRASRRRLGSASHLILCLTTTTPQTISWKALTNGCSLTVGCLGVEPTEVPTNGWIGPLAVTLWQSAAVGRAHCGADQWLSSPT